LIWYRDRFEVLSHAACEAPTEGLVLEFGVASGATINHLATSVALRERRIYGFDSFCGLPEPWADYCAGYFACQPPDVAANVGLVVGNFAETIPPFLEKHPGSAALIHLDADLYSSTKLVLKCLAPRIVPGTVIVMDEYFIVTDHEQRAFNEWLATNGRRCRPVARSLEQLLVLME
jgi:hypothetical protein